MMIDNFSALLPEIVLAVGAMLLMMLGVFRKENTETEASLGFATTAHSAMLVIAASAISIYIVDFFGLYGNFFNNSIVIDDLAIFAKTLILLAAFFVLWMTINYCQRHHSNFPYEYSILILFSLCGMLIMVSSADFLTLYLGVEMQSLAMYVLAGIDRRNAKASEASVKYFVLGALASGILLYGISLVYGFSGSINFADISAILSQQAELSKGMTIGIVLIVVGLAFKISAAPFHMWAPDVYEGAPTPVTAYFAIVPKLAVAVLLARILTDAFALFVFQWQDIIIILSILSMAVGAFAGIWQNNIKRLIAYSSIANMGYALIGIAAYASNGVWAMLVFFSIYMFATICIFALIMSINVRSKETHGGIEEITHLSGLAKSNPVVARLLALLMFSMIGLPFPPFAGFFGKFFIFKSAMDAGLYGLAVIGVLTSVVAAFYYLRVVKVMYFDELAENVRVNVNMHSSTKLILAILIFANIIVFFQPNKLLDEVPAVNFVQNFSNQQILNDENN